MSVILPRCNGHPARCTAELADACRLGALRPPFKNIRIVTLRDYLASTH